MGFKKIEPGVWKPEKAGDKVEGRLISVEPSKQFENKVYALETDKGEQMIVFGTSVLDNRLGYVKVGEKVQIVFKGTEPSKKGQDTKLFDVFKDDGKQ